VVAVEMVARVWKRWLVLRELEGRRFLRRVGCSGAGVEAGGDELWETLLGDMGVEPATGGAPIGGAPKEGGPSIRVLRGVVGVSVGWTVDIVVCRCVQIVVVSVTCVSMGQEWRKN